MKRIAFLMRYNYQKVGGGDVHQVKSYIPYLESKGYHCELLSNLDSNNVQDFDIFIIVNIDRPIETINYFSFLKKTVPKKKIYVIPIHHPISAINKFEAQEKGGIASFLCKLFADFYTREKVKNFVRSVKCYKFLPSSIKHLFVNYRSVLKHLLESVDGIIYISDGERQSVEKDFECSSNNYCIAYNAVDVCIENEQHEKKFDVVIVGRIEPRKNQLRAVKILSSMPLSVLIIGPTSEDNKKYNIDFKRILEIADNIQYLGAMKQQDVLSYLQKSKILLNASYFEVNPLVDLEAALSGCGIVTTKYSYSRESLPNVIEIDPWSECSIQQGVLSALKSPQNTIIDMNINSSWERSSQKIMALINK